MDISAIISYVGKYNTKIRLKKMIRDNPVKANDTTQDNTLMSYVLIAKYCLHLLKLVIVILTITYFLGMFWYIISLELHHATYEYRSTADASMVNVETYIVANNLELDLDDKLQDVTANWEQAVQLMYFAYTTLSTVGFGDKTPRSDYERLIICVVLLLGVSLFGYILGILVDIIDEFKAFDGDIDEGN